MEEIGVVKELHGPKAIVAVRKQSSCDACAAGGHCKAGDGGVAIEAINHAGAEVGDTVQVVFKAFTYLKGSLLLYGIPAVALIVGAVLGKEFLGAFFPGYDPDILSAFGGFALLGLSIVAVKLIVKQVEQKKEFIPVIERIIDKGRQ